jgi:dTDP-4-dehydrorhamnose reductase
MADALIGFSGFVGGTLLKQKKFDGLYRSTNIQDIRGKKFDTVVCAGAPAQKWIANKEPEADQRAIETLIQHLDSMTCKVFVLISTVDVFKSPLGVTEDTPVEEEGLHAYGRNRRLLEKFVENRFENALIVRLPGLVGPGLRKNVIFDFLNDNNVRLVESRGVFQFYPMVNLWYDIELALEAGLRLIHLTAEPVSVSEVSKAGFGREFNQTLEGTPARYDMQTRYAKIFGKQGDYQYLASDTLQAVRHYAQSEPLTLKNVAGPA